jgi:hypothetical protein
MKAKFRETYGLGGRVKLEMMSSTGAVVGDASTPEGLGLHQGAKIEVSVSH